MNKLREQNTANGTIKTTDQTQKSVPNNSAPTVTKSDPTPDIKSADNITHAPTKDDRNNSRHSPAKVTAPPLNQELKTP